MILSILAFLLIVGIYSNSDSHRAFFEIFGKPEEDNRGKNLIETEDGFIQIGTNADDSDGIYGLLLIKYDSDGIIQWAKRYETGTNYPYSKKTSDGGFITISTKNDILKNTKKVYISQFYSDGSLKRAIMFDSEIVYSDNIHTIGYDIIETTDHGFLAICTTNHGGFGSTAFGIEDALFLKFNSELVLQWCNRLSSIDTGQGQRDQIPYIAIQLSSDSGFVITGRTNRQYQTGEIFLLKLNSEGDIEWIEETESTTSHEGVCNGDRATGSVGRGIVEIMDTTGQHHLVIVGLTTCLGDNQDIFLVLYNPANPSNFRLVWAKRVGDGGTGTVPTPGGREYVYHVAKDENDGSSILLAGQSTSCDALPLLMKFNQTSGGGGDNNIDYEVEWSSTTDDTYYLGTQHVYTGASGHANSVAQNRAVGYVVTGELRFEDDEEVFSHMGAFYSQLEDSSGNSCGWKELPPGAFSTVDESSEVISLDQTAYYEYVDCSDFLTSYAVSWPSEDFFPRDPARNETICNECMETWKGYDCDVHDCPAGVYGETCEITICFGVWNNGSSPELLCSGHGRCLEPDTCDCYGAWHGSECQITECHGYSSDNPRVCNDHGTCIAYDVVKKN